MDFPLLKDIAVLLLLSIGVLLLCHRFRLPAIAGFILTGLLFGPHGAGFIKAADQVESVAQIGIILLLFGIGMEFSPRRFLSLRKTILLGGALQFLFSVCGGIAAALFVGRSLSEGIFLGFLLAMSSTAIVLKMLTLRGELKSRQGRLTLALLIFQDILVIPLMLFVPVLGGEESVSSLSIVWTFFEAILLLGITFILSLKIIPTLLDIVAHTRSRELFFLTVLAICFTFTWLASLFGLPLSLGAFLSGMILSDSDYRHQALGNILPFQEVFTSLFFISIGMLFELHYLQEHIGLILGVSTVVILFKMGTGFLATAITGIPLTTALLTGIYISQIGEFSFVLLGVGITHHLGTASLYQLFLGVSLTTMLLTPLLISLSSTWIRPLDQLKFLSSHKFLDATEEKVLDHHVIIVGFGASGKAIAKVCLSAHVPYCVLELNPDIVADGREQGEPIYFGDAGHDAVLKKVDIEHAEMVVILVNDVAEEKKIVHAAREASSHVYILMRTRTKEDLGMLKHLGADLALSDDVEISKELCNIVLERTRRFV